MFPYLINKLEKKYSLYLIDSNPLVKEMYANNTIFIVPLVKDNSYEDILTEIIIKYNIEFYIPLIDEEILKAINIASRTGIKTLCPTKEFVKMSLNKFDLMHELEKNGLSKIKTIMANNYDEDICYPIFLKPNIGRGSRGIRKINNGKEFNAYFILEDYLKDEILVQPFIEGDEYTVSVTVNNLNQIISIIPKFVFVKDGITKHAKSIKNKKIEDVCKKIVQKLKPRGSINVQLKENNDGIFIFEINPRFSTTLVLSIESGVNEIDQNIMFYNKQNVKYIEHFRETVLIRRWENIFLQGAINV